MSGRDPATESAGAAPAGGTLRLSFASSMREIGEAAWSGLEGGGQPFLSYAFLETLEVAGSVGGDTGWTPHHVTLQDGQGRLVAAMPAYVKDHSWGEFVFDWAWADAYRRYGLDYYPKLVCAVPFTPVTGRRVLMAPQADGSEVRPALLERLAEAVGEMDVSSLHLLFPDETDRAAVETTGSWMMRKDCQFQWRNRGYGDFADYLATFSSAKRKKVKRERRRIEEAGIGFDWLAGPEIDQPTWDSIYRFYAATFFRRGHTPYLDQEVLQLLAARLGDGLRVCLARQGGRPVAAAIFFRDSTTLYGRYWGCAEQFHSLHFETCYYQGIEFCIREGLQRFEPGTQGEHKLSRGFEPTTTWSAHVVGEPAFAAAIGDYLARERDGVDAYIGAAGEHLPFRRDSRG